jgi:hypothetical protein
MSDGGGDGPFPSLATRGLQEPNGNAESARIAERLAPVDALRMAELDAVCRQGTCRFCGRRLNDATLARSPGCCARYACRRRARRRLTGARAIR